MPCIRCDSPRLASHGRHVVCLSCGSLQPDAPRRGSFVLLRPAHSEAEPGDSDPRGYLVNYADQRALGHPDVRVQAASASEACELVARLHHVSAVALFAVPAGA